MNRPHDPLRCDQCKIRPAVHRVIVGGLLSALTGRVDAIKAVCLVCLALGVRFHPDPMTGQLK